MNRLSRYYPQSFLKTNHRCHPEIIEWPASAIYKGKITTSAGNSEAERVGNAWQGFTASLHHFKDNNLIGKRRLLIDAEGVAVQPSGSTAWQNEDHIRVVMILLNALYAHSSGKDQIVLEDVTLVCPYRGQVKQVIERFAVNKVRYNRCLTTHESLGQESNVVIFLFTKPRNSTLLDARFVSNCQELNVALTCAKQLLIVVANLRIWENKFISTAKAGSRRYLASFLQAVIDKGHKLTWVGQETVTKRVECSLLQARKNFEIDMALKQVEGAEARLAETQSTLDKERENLEAERKAMEKAMEERERAINAKAKAAKRQEAHLTKRKADLQLERDQPSKKAKDAA